jgi:hypothetical protein
MFLPIIITHSVLKVLHQPQEDDYATSGVKHFKLINDYE